MNLRENRRPSRMCPSFYHADDARLDVQEFTPKQEQPNDYQKEIEHSSPPPPPPSPESATSLDACYQSSRGSSSPSPVQEIDEPAYEQSTTDEKEVSSRKLSRMAEKFCFTQLENAAFFRLFDEYTRRRRRMPYTQHLKDQMDKDSFSEAMLLSSFPLDLKIEIFGYDSNSQSLDCQNDDSTMAPNGTNGNYGFNVFNGMNAANGCNGMDCGFHGGMNPVNGAGGVNGADRVDGMHREFNGIKRSNRVIAINTIRDQIALRVLQRCKQYSYF